MILEWSIAISNPHINESFRVTSTYWNGTKWKIIVVGTKKIISREQESLVFSEKIERSDPLIKRIIAGIKMILDNSYGNPLLIMYCDWLPKFVIFHGIVFNS